MKTRRLATLLFCCGIVLAAFVLYHVLGFDDPSWSEYEVHGVDVSSYQGEIDWQTLAAQDLQFAFIKATEGSTFVDERFEDNYWGALSTTLRVGAYHFFSYDSPGTAQAANFIATVPKTKDMLPPVVDIEFYGDKQENPASREETQNILTELLNALEEHYGVKPIIYTTQKVYTLYIAGTYHDYDIWISNIVGHPRLLDGKNWTFWQYSHHGELAGYQGEQKYIDLNVFSGSLEEFQQYGKEESGE